MNTETSVQTVPLANPVPKWRQIFRYLYIVAAGLIAFSVVVQVFLAGAAVTVHASYWPLHRSFGHTIELLIVLLCLIGIGTGLPWRIQSLGVLLFVLMFFQYLFLHLMPRIGMPILRSLHVVNALSFFWVALFLVWKLWQQLRMPKQTHHHSVLSPSENEARSA